jgi:hypothetical protein
MFKDILHLKKSRAEAENHSEVTDLLHGEMKKLRISRSTQITQGNLCLVLMLEACHQQEL